jgi:Cu(I)/Ag(I) efflux system membrane fusion protein
MSRRRTLAALVAVLSLARCSPAPDEHAQHAPKASRSDAGHVAHEATPASPREETSAPPPGMAAVDVAPERVQALGVRTAAVECRALVRRIRAVAVVAPDERVVRKIQTRVSGWIERLFVDFTGAEVAAGDAIVSIYSPEVVAAQREYLLARAALDDRVAQADGDARALLDSARTRLAYWGLTDAQVRELARTGAP